MSFVLSPSAKSFVRHMLRYASGCSGLVADVENEARGEAAAGAALEFFPEAKSRLPLDLIAWDFGELPIRLGVICGRRAAPLGKPYRR